jgi:hypothetical protein
VGGVVKEEVGKGVAVYIDLIIAFVVSIEYHEPRIRAQTCHFPLLGLFNSAITRSNE